MISNRPIEKLFGGSVCMCSHVDHFQTNIAEFNSKSTILLSWLKDYPWVCPHQVEKWVQNIHFKQNRKFFKCSVLFPTKISSRDYFLFWEVKIAFPDTHTTPHSFALILISALERSKFNLRKIYWFQIRHGYLVDSMDREAIANLSIGFLEGALHME